MWEKLRIYKRAHNDSFITLRWKVRAGAWWLLKSLAGLLAFYTVLFLLGKVPWISILWNNPVYDAYLKPLEEVDKFRKVWIPVSSISLIITALLLVVYEVWRHGHLGKCDNFTRAFYMAVSCKLFVLYVLYFISSCGLLVLSSEEIFVPPAMAGLVELSLCIAVVAMLLYLCRAFWKAMVSIPLVGKGKRHFLKLYLLLHVLTIIIGDAVRRHTGIPYLVVKCVLFAIVYGVAAYTVLLGLVSLNDFMQIQPFWMANSYFSGYLDIVCNADHFRDIVIGCMAVAGVFLTLYSTNLVTVFQYRYAKAPEQILRLFLNQVSASRIIRCTIWYLIFCCFLLAEYQDLVALTQEELNAGTMGVPRLVCLAFYAFTLLLIVLFKTAGFSALSMTNAFLLMKMDYNTLYVISRFMERWHDKLSSSLYGICVERLIGVNDVTEYGLSGDSVPVRSLCGLIDRNFLLLHTFVNAKRGLPFDSAWFPMVPANKKVQDMDPGERRAAAEGSAALVPEAIRDKWSIETILWRINKQVMTGLCKNREFFSFYRLMRSEERTLAAPPASLYLSPSDIHFFIIRVEELQGEILRMEKPQGENLDQYAVSGRDLSLLVLTITGFYYALLHNCGTAVQNTIQKQCTLLRKLDSDTLAGVSTFKGLDIITYPFLNTPAAARWFNYAAMERGVEGKTITFYRNMQRYGAESIHGELMKAVRCVNLIDRQIFPQLIQVLVKKKEYHAAGIALCQMDLMDPVIVSLSKCCEDLDKELAEFSHGLRGDLIHSDELIQRIKRSHASFLEWRFQIVQFLLDDYRLYEGREFPDVTGLQYIRIAETMFECITADNFELFKHYYASFIGVNRKYIQLVGQWDIEKGKTEREVEFDKADAAYDLFNISSFACLWGNIYGDERWEDLIHEVCANYGDTDWIGEIQRYYGIGKRAPGRAGHFRKEEWERKFCQALAEKANRAGDGSVQKINIELLCKYATAGSGGYTFLWGVDEIFRDRILAALGN